MSIWVLSPIQTTLKSQFRHVLYNVQGSGKRLGVRCNDRFTGDFRWDFGEVGNRAGNKTPNNVENAIGLRSAWQPGGRRCVRGWPNRKNNSNRSVPKEHTKKKNLKKRAHARANSARSIGAHHYHMRCKRYFDIVI